MMNPASIEKHLSAIDKLLNSLNTSETDVKRHLRFVTTFPIFLFKIPAETYVYRPTRLRSETMTSRESLNSPGSYHAIKSGQFIT